MYSGCRVTGSRGWAELSWRDRRREGNQGKRGERARKYRRRKDQKKRPRTILRWCNTTGADWPSSSAAFLSFISSLPLAARLLALASERYIRGGVTGAPNKPLTSLLCLRPFLPPQRARATLIHWCRFTVTDQAGEPLVSSLQFQNVLLNVLLFFSSSSSSLLHKLSPFFAAAAAFFMWSLTQFLQISDVAAWIIPSGGLVWHLTQTVRKTKDEEQLHPAQTWDQTPFLWEHIFPYSYHTLCGKSSSRIHVCREATPLNSSQHYADMSLLSHHFLLIKQFVCWLRRIMHRGNVMSRF